MKARGKMKGVQVKLNINGNVKPITQKKRRIPFHLRDRVDYEIESLEDMVEIEDSEGLAPWVSSMVVVHKPKRPSV